MGRRSLALIILMSFLFSLSGCWSRREIEKLAIATVIAYDKVTINGQQKWMASAIIIKPSALGGKGPLGGNGGQGAKSPRLLVSSLGDTIWEAGRNLSTRIPRREYLAHINVIIIGEKLAREGLDKFIDDLLRSKDIRLNTWILVTKGQAIDVLRAEPELEELLSQEILGLVQNNQPAVSEAVTIDIKRFVNQLITPGRDAVVSFIEIFDRGGETSQAQEGKNSGSTVRGSQALRLRGSSVFRKGKLVGFLEDWETKGYLYAIGKAKEGIISLSMHGHTKKDVAFAMTRTRSKIIPRVNSEEIAFTIDIKAEGDLQQHEDTSPIASPENIKLIEQLAAQEIKHMVEEIVKKAKDEFNADIFGFGDRLHKQYPKVWNLVEKDWGEIYPDVKVTVDVEAKIRRTGMITNTPIIR
jgi:spore germination protein KC